MLAFVSFFYDILLMNLQTKTSGLPVKGLNPNYTADVRLFNTWLDGRPVNAESVSDYFSEIKKSYRAATVSRKKAALKKAIAEARGTALTLAEAAQLDTLFKRIKTPTPDKAIHEHEVLERGEVFTLMLISGPKTAAIFTALYNTGCRVSELVNLKLSDCTVKEKHAVCRVLGKGQKERTVFMPIEAFNALRELYQGKTYLIETNGKPISRHSVYTLLKRAGLKIGRPDVNPHKLRHSKATHLLKNGMSLPAVSAYLGHADGATTARYYLHDTPTAAEVLKDSETITPGQATPLYPKPKTENRK